MWPGPLPTTVAQRFFDETPTIRSAGTRKVWLGYIRRLERRNPGKRINEYEPEDLRRFLLTDAPDDRPTRRAHSTLAVQRTWLRSFFSWAQFAGLTETDPSLNLNRLVPLKPTPVRQHHWLDKTEIEALFEACYSDSCELLGRRDALAIAFAVQVGLRIHEIAGVRWGSLQLNKGRASVLGKGGKLASVSLPANLVAELKQWKSTVTDGLGRIPSAEDPVLIAFVSQGGAEFRSTRQLAPRWSKPCGLNGLRQAIKKRGAQIGLPDLAPHDLRRSYAGLLEDSGLELRAIQSGLRHSSVATTERYLANNPSKWEGEITGVVGGIDIVRKVG